MRFTFTRRKLIGRTLSAATMAGITSQAADALGKAATTASQDAPVTGLPTPQWVRLQQIVERLSSASGASLVGFTRADSGAVPGTVQRKLAEFPSITDFGALADDRTDSVEAIQRAIDALHDAGGGALLIPAGTFRIERAVRLRSNVKLQGAGPASVLHLVNRSRGDALRAEGDRSARLSRIAVRDITIAGDARFSGGTPNVINGSGLIFVHADDCDVTDVTVLGFSDNGICFLNGNRNSVMNCRVEETAQGISFTANDISVTGNVAVGNRIANTGTYNGLHLEGGFGGKTTGEVRHTTLSGNTVSASWETGINIELAPYTSCVGNTVDRSGLGRTAINMGIKVYGGFRSTICGNIISNSTGDGIVVGANSSECSVEGNTTAGNNGSLLLTDSGAQISNDVAIGLNSFTEGDIRTSGNVRIRNRTMGFNFVNRASSDPQTLDWYEEGRFIPLVEGSVLAGSGTYTIQEGMFTRIGNVVHVALRIGWSGHSGKGGIRIKGLPYPATAGTHLMALRQSGNDQSENIFHASAAASQTMLVLRAPIWPDNADHKSRGQAQQISIAGQYLTKG